MQKRILVFVYKNFNFGVRIGFVVSIIVFVVFVINTVCCLNLSLQTAPYNNKHMIDKKLDNIIFFYKSIMNFYESSLGDKPQTSEASITYLRKVHGSLPMIKPSKGGVSSFFGNRWIMGRRRFHRGIDFAAPSGSPVFAAAGGVVQYAGIKRGYGNVVIIKHSYGFETRYAHLSKILVRKNDIVQRGDIIGLVGTTGWSFGPHLHYEVRLYGIPQNPLKYIFPYYFRE